MIQGPGDGAEKSEWCGAWVGFVTVIIARRLVVVWLQCNNANEAIHTIHTMLG
jgi:hypothetical protein